MFKSENIQTKPPKPLGKNNGWRDGVLNDEIVFFGISIEPVSNRPLICKLNKI